MPKRGQHHNDGLNPSKPRGHEKSRGVNHPDRSQPITTQSYKKKETYALTLGEFIEGGEEDGDEIPVSIASPLGKGLLGCKRGQTVSLALPVGKRRLKIVQVLTVHDLAAGAPE